MFSKNKIKNINSNFILFLNKFQYLYARFLFLLSTFEILLQYIYYIYFQFLNCFQYTHNFETFLFGSKLCKLTKIKKCAEK